MISMQTFDVKFEYKVNNVNGAGGTRCRGGRAARPQYKACAPRHTALAVALAPTAESTAMFTIYHVIRYIDNVNAPTMRRSTAVFIFRSIIRKLPYYNAL
uniref:Uncharacterized protein n=1 Tax=Pectinophora gossypiella TaxID=13191 RepID=A0A1E1WRJ1_PECGO